MGPAAGIGVQGEGTRFGIEGVVVSTSAEAAVHGWAAAGASAAHGIKGQAEASTSRAVIGLHEHSEGIALEGRAHSTDPGSATGVLGASSAIGGFGVRGEGSTGVRGTGGTGVSAEGAQFGVSGLATETTGVGVEGVASSPTGNTTGVLARALSPAGVALKAENFADDAVTAHFQAWGGGATVALRSESRGDVPGALALHATLDNGSGDGAALFAEHRGGGVAVKLDGVLRMTPRASAPASCELGDLYVHDSGALCFCNGALAWERINTAGLCP